MGDQLSPFSQLISWSYDHHFVHLFWWKFIITTAMSEGLYIKLQKGVVIKALLVAS